MDSENAVVLDWVLRVNYLDKGPKLLDHFDIICAYPKVGAHDEVFEKRFAKSFVVQSNPQFCQNLNSLAVYSSQGHRLQYRK